MKWRDCLDNCIGDMGAIQTAKPKEALAHMRDAQENLTKAIEALEEEVEG